MFISPFPSNSLTSTFALREKALASDYFITLSITEIYTTYTTIIQLGNGQMTLTGQAASPTPQSTASSIEPIVYSSSNGISGGDIAAIIGCILGVLLVLFVFCTSRRGKRGPRGLPGEPGAPGRDGHPAEMDEMEQQEQQGQRGQQEHEENEENEVCGGNQESQERLAEMAEMRHLGQEQRDHETEW